MYKGEPLAASVLVGLDLIEDADLSEQAKMLLIHLLAAKQGSYLLSEAEALCPAFKPSTIKRLLNELVNNGWLLRQFARDGNRISHQYFKLPDGVRI